MTSKLVLSILNTMAHETVGNQIKELRSILGMTQAQLAEMVGVARVSIIAIETGRYIPTIETALRISKALNAPVDQIFWLKEETT
ncbi:MAG TPA: helix-turn-helix transcriptional regulator [Anaerolineales bacterium]|nr:helix-turn-helix transcriptional regulator [Anaerolineales bacterium]